MRLSYETDAGAGRRARIGIIVLRTDESLEPEMARMTAVDGVAVHYTRIHNADEVTESSLRMMEERIPAVMRLFPQNVEFNAVGYACTSGATVIGPNRVAELVRSTLSNGADVAVTDPLTAVKAACRALGIHRIGFVTPYVPEVSAAMQSALEDDGFEIAGFGSFEQADDREVAHIAEESTLSAILETGRSVPCDGVFASCTNLRSIAIVERAERELGKPVISSNLALAWQLLRSSGIEDRRPGFGMLLSEK